MIGRKALGKSRLPQPARDAYQWVNRAQGRLDASKRALPNFFVAGTQRGGTTSLFIHLLHHPLVFGPRRAKGVHYFDTSFDMDLNWYRAHFPRRSTVQRLHDEIGAVPAIGEGAPYYMYNPLIASRIAGVVPDARIIMILRDPLERAVSHHNHEVSRGFEDLSLIDALNAEPERLAGETERMRADASYVSYEHIHHSYIGRSQYADQLERFLKLFARDQILVLDSSSLSLDPAGTVREATDFLGLPPLVVDPEIPRYNTRVHDPITPGLRERFGPLFAESNRRLSQLVPGRLSWLDQNDNVVPIDRRGDGRRSTDRRAS